MKQFLSKNIKLFKRQEGYVKIAAACMGTLILASLVYTVICCFSKDVSQADIVAIVLNILVAALGFYAIFASVQNDREIKRYEFAAEYNHNFLTNKTFMDVERKLESCYQEYKRVDNDLESEWSSEKKHEFEEYCDLVFGTADCKFSDDPRSPNTRIGEDGLIKEEYQAIINYLVYLESFVPLIINGQLFLEDVSNLFGYRYFIAVNNPVLQRNELLRERPYYRGCFDVYEMWSKHCEDIVPMKEYALPDEWKRFKKDNPKAKE